MSETTPCRALPQINAPAADFEAKTTHGIKKLADYKGKWLVLFSHPAGFTPVCTTEFMVFAKHHPEFQKLNCDLLGLSIDGYYSHVAWVRNIKEKFRGGDSFPHHRRPVDESRQRLRDAPSGCCRYVGGARNLHHR